jgi:CubicO group peptidase (beta-lactamase class C family)
MTKNTFIIFLFTALLSVAGFAQTINKAKLDSLFTSLAVNNKAMGSIAISKNGKLLYSKAIGYSLYSDDKKIPSAENSKYRIGSISKIFTAAIIFQLIEEGKTSLTTLLENYFPQYPNSARITISNLLNHRSGIRNTTSVESKETPRTREEMLTIIAKKTPKYKPGKRSSYSNSNFLLLGYIIEKICKKSYAEVLQERIVSKIGLTNTYYGHKANIEKNECLPYRFNKDWEQQPQTDLSIPGASGGLISTPTDMVFFMEALFSKKIISENSLNQMKTITNGHGMGFLEFEFDKKKALGYIGGIDEYESVLAYFTGDSLAIAWCSNGRVYPIRGIVTGSLNIYFDKIYSIPDFKLLTIKPGHLKKYTGVYSSSEISIRIKISRHKQNLIAQPSGYSSYPLDAIGLDKFKNDEASVAIEFDPKKNAMRLKRGDMSYHFIKEN